MLVPQGMTVEPGQFVVAPSRTVEYLGVVWPRDENPAPKIKREKLQAIVEAIDDVPKLPPVSLDFARLGVAIHARARQAWCSA